MKNLNVEHNPKVGDARINHFIDKMSEETGEQLPHTVTILKRKYVPSISFTKAPVSEKHGGVLKRINNGTTKIKYTK